MAFIAAEKAQRPVTILCRPLAVTPSGLYGWAARGLSARAQGDLVWRTNAIQHAGDTPIVLTGQEQGDSVTLAVHNGGPAIPAEVLPFVFESLACSRTAGAPQSLGLGLFIAQAIVSAHHGHIQVSSSTEGGTTFTVRLPKAP